MLAVQEFWGKEKNFTMEKKQNHFSGQLGFVLAAAGSAVGVGNLWRFPYLAAKDGGGLFLIIYFILVLTFGFTLLTSDIAIARRTKKVMLQAVLVGLGLAIIGMVAAAFNLIPVVVGAFMQEAIDVVSILWALTVLFDRGESA